MRNRKKSDTYRFNGISGIKPMKIADLEQLVASYQAKLADPSDADDKKWVARWLKRFELELDKKRRALAHKTKQGIRQRGIN